MSGWERVRAVAYGEARRPWGGATVSQATGALAGAGFAVAVPGERFGETITIPGDAAYSRFCVAFDEARVMFTAPWLGVFHDADAGVIEFDPVLVVADEAAVDALFAAGFPVAGGAYDFGSGNGYWPAGARAEEVAA